MKTTTKMRYFAEKLGFF